MVPRERRPASQHQRLARRSLGLRAVPRGQLRLGQPLERVRGPGLGAQLAVQRHGVAQIPPCGFDLASQQFRLAGDARGEGHGPTGSRPLGVGPQLMRQRHHLGVRRRAVEEVLRDADVAVEDLGRQGRALPRGPQLAQQPVEPLAPVMGDHPFERDDVQQDVGGLRRQSQLTGLLDDPLCRGDVAGEVGMHAHRHEDLSVVGATAEGQPVERLGCRRHVPRHHRRPRQAGAQADDLIRGRQRQRRAIGEHGARIA